MRRIAAEALSFVLAAGLLAGCSSHEEQEAELEESMTEALASLEEETSDEEASEEEGQESEELSVTEALASQLTEDEQLLAADTGITEVAFEGEMPDEEVTIPEDAVLWLVVPAGNISCAVYAGESDLIAGEVDEDGSYEAVRSLVWLDAGNEADMKDPNSVFHSYGIQQGDGLYGLLEFGDASVFDEEPYLYVYLDDAVREYRVFAAYSADTENILVQHNCYSQEHFYSYVDEIYSQRSMTALVNEDLRTNVEAIWKIATFQVTIDDGEDFIVQAVPTGILAR